MSVSLPSEFVPFVNDLVATGNYSTAEDAIREWHRANRRAP